MQILYKVTNDNDITNKPQEMGSLLLWKTKGYITNIDEFLIQKDLQKPQNYFNGCWPLFSLPENVIFHLEKTKILKQYLENGIFQLAVKKI